MTVTAAATWNLFYVPCILFVVFVMIMAPLEKWWHSKQYVRSSHKSMVTPVPKHHTIKIFWGMCRCIMETDEIPSNMWNY